MAGHIRIISSAKAERLRRKAGQKRSDKRKLVVQICLLGLLMIGAVVADYLFIQWGRYQRHRQQPHQPSATNSVAGTNRPPPQ